MKKRIVSLTVLMLISVSARAGDGQYVPAWVNQPISINTLQPCSAQDLLDFLTYRQKEKFSVDGSVVSATNPPPSGVKIKWRFEAVPQRYVMSWLAHFLDATAVVRDESVVITKEALPGDTPITGFAETNGVWRTGIEKSLQRTLTPPGRAFDWVQYVDYLTFKADVPFLTDPGLHQSILKQTKVELEQKEQTVASALSSVLAQVDATFTLQGGLVFVTRKGTIAQPEN